MNKYQKNAALLSCLAMLAQSTAAFPVNTVSAAETTGKLFINEACAKNTEFKAPDGNCYDWIELYNASSSPVDISGFGITDDETKPGRFTFPQGTSISAGEHLLVYCNSTDFSVSGAHCAVFGLSTDGETVILTDRSGNVVDSVTFGAIDANVSYGRKSDGSSEYGYMNMTPGTSNAGSSVIQTDVPAPVFSQAGGYYNGSLSVSLSSQNNAKIYYTLDGSEPDMSSELYSSPIEVSVSALERLRNEALAESGEQNQNPAPNTPGQPGANPGFQQPGGWGGFGGDWGGFGGDWGFGNMFSNVKAGSPDAEKDVFVIRAVSVDSQGNRSASVTQSYFLGIQNTASYYNDMKIISIATDSAGLNDSQTGIYANFNQTGREWERPASMTIYVNGKEEISQNIGIRIHGGYTRQFNQKSFNVYARSDYGNSKLEYDLFSGNLRSEATGKKIKKFDSFILRNAGNDCESTRFRDKLNQHLVRDRNFLSQAMEPAVVFINGEYFGHYEITEKIGADFISDHTDVAKKNICMIKNEELEEGDQSSFNEYEELGRWIKQTDFSNASNYAQLSEKVDIDSFIDYMGAQIFFGNKDWGKNNYALWKAVTPDSSNPYADGRWRFILFDTEYSANMYNQIPANTNTLQNIMRDGSWIGTLLSQALKNEEFSRKFATAFMDMANYNFDTDKIQSLISQYSEQYKPLAVDTFNKFWAGKDNESTFTSGVQTVSSFYKERYSAITSAVKSTLSLKGQLAQVTVKNDSKCGTVKVNTLTPDMSSGSYSGKYFTDFPVTVTAEPAEGYVFTGWKLSDGTTVTGKTAQIKVSEGMTVTAVYSAGSSNSQTGTDGDVNNDGSVNASDIIALIRHLTGQKTYSSSDVNGDGKINIVDLITLKNMLVK